jgi:hypothetical protein
MLNNLMMDAIWKWACFVKEGKAFSRGLSKKAGLEESQNACLKLLKM